MANQIIKDIKNADSTGLSAIVVVLDMLAIHLADIAKDVEASVNGVCSGFQGISMRARNALSSAADALDDSADGGGLQAFVHRVRMALEVMLQRIASSREFAVHLAAEMDEINQRIDALCELNRQLGRVGQLTKQTINSTRQSIESGVDSDEVMEALLEKTGMLATAANATSNSFMGIIVNLSSSVKKLSSRVKSKGEEEKEATTSGENAVRNMLDKLTATYDKMSQSLSNSAAMSRQLNLDIGQAVMSMQFQDRVNQRIQHLIETISELASELQPFTGDADKDKAKTISDYWLERVAAKATMQVERINPEEASANSSGPGDIELF